MSFFSLENLLLSDTVDETKTNLLLIDNAVMESHVFAESANSSTFPIIYSSTSTKSDLLSCLRMNFTTIDRIAVCFIGSSSNSSLFLDNQPFFNNENESSESSYSENIAFLISVIKEFKVTNIDFLACDTLNYPEWVNYYNILSKETNVVVGASNNKTGNINYGGDWIMESTCQDIELIYFNKNIEYYKYLLDLTYSTILISNADGVLYVCGSNDYGQLGIGNTISPQTSLIRMSSMPFGKTPLTVSCGQIHTIVLMTDFSIWGCGYNNSGQLGIGNSISPQTSLTQMSIPSGKTPLAVSCGGYHTIVLMTDFSIWGCGYNAIGELGIGNTTQQNSLIRMSSMDQIPAGLKPISVSCGGYHTIILMTDASNNVSIYVCGNNGNGQLGIGNTTSQNSLIQMSSIPAGLKPISVSCSFYTTIILMTNASNNVSIYGCGSNFRGELGIGNTTQQTWSLIQMSSIPAGKTPLAVSGGFSHTIVLMTDFSIWGCGWNAQGQLGIGNIVSPQKSLTQITYLNPLSGMTISSFCRLSNSRPNLSTMLNTYSLADVRPVGYTKAEFTAANPLYTTSFLKASPQSYTARQLRVAGYTINEMLGAGFTLADLAPTGYSKAEFTEANPLYTASYLKAAPASYTALQLRVAGFTTAELKTSGFTATELKTAGFTLSDFRYTILRIWYRDTYGDGWDNGRISFKENSTNVNLITLTGPASDTIFWFYTDISFKNNTVYNVTKINGYYPSEILFAITTTAISSYLNTTTLITTSTSSTVLTETSNISTFSVPSSYYYSVAELKTAGFTLAELKTTGFTINEMLGAGFTLADLAPLGYTKSEFTAANSLYTAAFLKASPQSYTALQLRVAGFTASELKEAGYTFIESRDAGFSLSELSIYFPTISNVYISNNNEKYIYIVGTKFVSGDTVSFVGTAGVSDSSSYSVNFINAELLKVTMISPYDIDTVTVTDIYGNPSNTFTLTADLISNICFIAGTPVTTDQGNIPIEKIDTSIHTIRNKKIVAITKTVTQDKYLVCFEKDALGKNIPSLRTIISKNHNLFYNGKMRMAKEFFKDFSNVVKVKYTGSVLYNVLLEEHDKMMVNNLICETLHPENGVAKVYMALQKLNTEGQKLLIKKINAHVIKNNVFNGNKKLIK